MSQSQIKYIIFYSKNIAVSVLLFIRKLKYKEHEKMIWSLNWTKYIFNFCLKYIFEIVSSLINVNILRVPIQVKKGYCWKKNKRWITLFVFKLRSKYDCFKIKKCCWFTSNKLVLRNYKFPISFYLFILLILWSNLIRHTD